MSEIFGRKEKKPRASNFNFGKDFKMSMKLKSSSGKFLHPTQTVRKRIYVKGLKNENSCSVHVRNETGGLLLHIPTVLFGF